jgi:hypothetical protein
MKKLLGRGDIQEKIIFNRNLESKFWAWLLDLGVSGRLLWTCWTRCALMHVKCTKCTKQSMLQPYSPLIVSYSTVIMEPYIHFMISVLLFACTRHVHCSISLRNTVQQNWLCLRTLPNAGHFSLPHRLPAVLNCGRISLGVVIENVELWSFVLREPASVFHRWYRSTSSQYSNILIHLPLKQYLLALTPSW